MDKVMSVASVEKSGRENTKNRVINTLIYKEKLV